MCPSLAGTLVQVVEEEAGWQPMPPQSAGVKFCLIAGECRSRGLSHACRARAAQLALQHTAI